MGLWSNPNPDLAALPLTRPVTTSAARSNSHPLPRMTRVGCSTMWVQIS